MKKLLPLFMLALVCTLFCAIAEEEPQSYASGEYKYILLEDGTAEITYYSGEETSLVIPEQFDGHPVSSLADFAFAASYIKEITIPDYIVHMGVNPFSSCFDLSRIIVAPENTHFEVIDGVLFDKNEKKLIAYPCALDAPVYEIPAETLAIGEAAFEACEFIKQITVPAGVKHMGTNPFRDCWGLTEIIVSSENEHFEIINGVLFDKNEKKLIAYPCTFDAAVYEIPAGTLVIGNSAFASCESLTQIIIPDTVTAIEDNAFFMCSSLTEIAIPDSITSISDFAFFYCISLTKVTLPDSLTAIGDSAFFACDALAQITLPNSVTAIGDSAFSSCISLTEFVIPNGVTEIADSVFSYCQELTQITIPDSVISIGDSAFSSCSALTQINIPNSVTAIGEFAFDSCSALTQINIPNSVATIGLSAFSACESLTQITLPDSLTAIEDYAFYACPSLAEITIPNGVTSIGNQAFFYCKSLSQITIPESVTSIEANAFKDCNKDIVFNVVEGSYAEKWAAENNYKVSFES